MEGSGQSGAVSCQDGVPGADKRLLDVTLKCMGQLLRGALLMNNLRKAAVALASLRLSCTFYLSISACVDYQLGVSVPNT